MKNIIELDLTSSYYPPLLQDADNVQLTEKPPDLKIKMAPEMDICVYSKEYTLMPRITNNFIKWQLGKLLQDEYEFEKKLEWIKLTCLNLPIPGKIILKNAISRTNHHPA